ncbi:hypothetical protein OS188_14110 [Xanthomarina sp. F1114]|uniref:hypothetical protein n=1 Tax=Xanthomarina sp. F1114 TaxID=2996019 RepID=UPI00225DD864|nr:hypothetical protein [Xanthomarina sp. F1114]MCX7549087.1 hypothetical protein [Xanthomarina sp. F1114]
MNKNKLHNIKQSGFKTPEDYFSNLEDNIMSQIHLDKKIDKTVFKTPESYFDSLEDRILNKISDNQETKVISLVTKRTLIAVSSVAAAIVLLFNLNLFSKDFSFSTIETEVLEKYVSNQEFDTYDLETELIEDIDISSFILEESISDASLENYLYNTSDLEDFISD